MKCGNSCSNNSVSQVDRIAKVLARNLGDLAFKINACPRENKQTSIISYSSFSKFLTRIIPSDKIRALLSKIKKGGTTKNDNHHLIPKCPFECASRRWILATI